MNDKSQVEYILNDIKAIVNNVIIKLSYISDMYETVDSRREADRYIAAYTERDTFNSYSSYPIDVLVNAGITDAKIINEYNQDKRKIPRNKRDEVLKQMRKSIINDYVETNDYYRELIGLPPINSSEDEWFYLTEEEMQYYEIDEIRPIHDYPQEILIKLERIIIPDLIKLHPEKTYLTHMGSKAVNLIRAREAKNFEIIYSDISLDRVFMRAFFTTYDFCREYFMNMIYNKHFKARYDLYDNYIGMHIMIMTVQRVIADSIKMCIDRDFYDIISIRKLFNSYGVPFFEDLPLDYQRTIVKNLNMMLRSKSTDKVLYDVANTLFYERVQIYKYYLVKERLFDEKGEPVFEYKEINTDEINRVFIKSNNGDNYQLVIQDGILHTIKIENSAAHAPTYIYIKDETTGKKFRLFINGDRLCSEDVDDNDIMCDNVFLFDFDENKFKLFFDSGNLCSTSVESNIIETYDYDKMFKVYFQSADIMDKNTIATIETKYTRYEYEDIIEDDVYWWETEELKKELYEREYNFIDTKYIGINIMQNLTNLLYETCYYMNMIVDNKDNTVPFEYRILNRDAIKTGTDYIYIVLDRISSTPISLFDTIAVLCALVSKKNGMKGNIIASTPAKILSVMGFNFEINFDLLRENIKKYKRIFKNQEILKYLDLLDIKTVDDVNTLYNNFKNFADFCIDIIANTKDINEYKTFKELYKVFTVREETGEAFKLSNGEIAATYIEYLEDKLPYIAEFIKNLHKEETGIYIEHAIGKLNELIPEIEYLSAMNGTNNNIIDALVSLINFFKSYTVDLRNLNVMFMFNNKAINKIFMIDDPRLKIAIQPKEITMLYNDNIDHYIGFDKFDNLIIYDKKNLFNKLIPKDYYITNDCLDITEANMQYNEIYDLSYRDLLSNVIFDLRISENKNYEEMSHILDKLYTINKINIQQTGFVGITYYRNEQNCIGQYSDEVIMRNEDRINDNLINKELIKVIHED